METAKKMKAKEKVSGGVGRGGKGKQEGDSGEGESGRERRGEEGVRFLSSGEEEERSRVAERVLDTHQNTTNRYSFIDGYSDVEAEGGRGGKRRKGEGWWEQREGRRRGGGRGGWAEEERQEKENRRKDRKTEEKERKRKGEEREKEEDRRERREREERRRERREREERRRERRERKGKEERRRERKGREGRGRSVKGKGRGGKREREEEDINSYSSFSSPLSSSFYSSSSRSRSRSFSPSRSRSRSTSPASSSGSSGYSSSDGGRGSQREVPTPSRKELRDAHKVLRRMRYAKRSTAYRAQAQKIADGGATRKELTFIDKMVSYLRKGMMGRVCRVVEKRRAALFLGLTLGWEVADAYEGGENLGDMGVSRGEVRDAVKLAERRRRLFSGGRGRGGGKGAEKSAHRTEEAPVSAAQAGGSGQTGRRGPTSDDTCNRCGRRGHWAFQCSLPRNRGSYPGPYSGAPGGIQNAPPSHPNPNRND